MMREIVFACLALPLLAACGSEPAQTTAGGAKAGCATRAYSEIGGPISLVDQTGTPVTEEDFKGRPSLVYFGFTYCPDVCPMTLVKLKQAYAGLPDGMTPPRTILITVDPERDTPQALADYIATDAFPEDITGLTGTPEQIRAAADAFKADFSRVDMPESQADYTMDHTSILYLMDEDWSLKTFFTGHDKADTIATCLADLMEQGT